MSASFIDRRHPEAPPRARLARLGTAEPETFRFSLVSRGDFVHGRLQPVAGSGPATSGASQKAPLLLVGHGLGGSLEDVLAGGAGGASFAPQTQVAEILGAQDCSVAAIDLPLHGERSSPKLSARLVEGVTRLARNEPLDPETEVLVEEFARQSHADLIRTAEALAELDFVDETRIGYFGFSVGAWVGSYALARAPFRSSALAVVGGGSGRPDLDPATYLGEKRPGPSPLLILGAENDDRAPIASAQRLFDAASEPKAWHAVRDTLHDGETLSRETLAEARAFFAQTLAL